jgi:hypothetical protein
MLKMKKISLLILVSSTTLFCYSQATKPDTVKIRAAAVEYCECTGPALKPIHPFILDMLEAIAKNGEKAGEDTLVARLGSKPEAQADVMKSVEYLDSEAFQKAIEGCETKLKSKYPFLDDKKPANRPNCEYFDKLMEFIPGCKTVYYMSVIGQKEGD